MDSKLPSGDTVAPSVAELKQATLKQLAIAAAAAATAASRAEADAAAKVPAALSLAASASATFLVRKVIKHMHLGIMPGNSSDVEEYFSAFLSTGQHLRRNLCDAHFNYHYALGNEANAKVAAAIAIDAAIDAATAAGLRLESTKVEVFEINEKKSHRNTLHPLKKRRTPELDEAVASAEKAYSGAHLNAEALTSGAAYIGINVDPILAKYIKHASE